MIPVPMPSPLALVDTDADAIWVHIQGRAFPTTGEQQSTAAFRRVMRADAAGRLRLHTDTPWRPHHPAASEDRAIHLSLVRLGRVLDKTELDGRQWDRVHNHGLDAFLLEAIATRSFAAPRQRVLGHS